MGMFNSDVKQAYRETVWEYVHTHARGSAATRTVALLGSSEALEVKYLQDIGYDPYNILAINFSKGQHAGLTRALNADPRIYSPVNIATGDLVEVLLRRIIRDEEHFDVVHADFCGALTLSRIDDIRALGKILKRTVLIINVRAGREKGSELIEHLKDRGRTRAITDILEIHGRPRNIKMGSYIAHAPSKMEWVACCL